MRDRSMTVLASKSTLASTSFDESIMPLSPLVSELRRVSSDPL